MSTGRSAGRAGAARLKWGLRVYAWLLVLCIVQIAVAAPIVQALRPYAYESTALVVARQLKIAPAALPRFGEAVFERGTLARKLVSDPTIGGDADGLIPDRLRVVTPQDSVVFQVIGRDEDPAQAARIANAAALEFIAQLNLPGAGVGSFALQDAAAVPTEPANRRTSLSLLIPVALLSGAAFGFGLILLILAVRRPVVDPDEVEDLLELPVLGTVTVPRFRRDEFFGPDGVRGIPQVTRALLGQPASFVYLAGPESTVAVRQRITVMLAITMRRLLPVRVRSTVKVEQLVFEATATTEAARPAAGPAGPPRFTLVDGAEPLDRGVPQDEVAKTVLVIPEGMPRERLRELTADYLYDELLGVVVVRTRFRRRSHAKPLGPVSATPQGPAAQQGPVNQGPVNQGPVKQGPVDQGPVPPAPAPQAPARPMPSPQTGARRPETAKDLSAPKPKPSPAPYGEAGPVRGR